LKTRKKISLLVISAVMLSCVSCGQTSKVQVASGSKETSNVATESSKADDSQEKVIEVKGDTYPLTVKDYLKDDTVIDKKPERVAVLAGTQLNIWYDLGGKSICTSNITSNVKLLSQFKDEVLKLPTVGKVNAMDMEKIISLKPDLIITQVGSQAEESQKLKQMGFKVITTNIKGYDDVISTYKAFGKILGETQKAEQCINNLDKKKGEIISKLPEKSKSVAILYVTSKSVAVKLDNSIAGDIAKILKLKNIASDAKPDSVGSETTPLDVEYIVAQNPDHILVTSMIADNETAKKTMEEQFTKNPAWKGVKAISEGRVVYLPQEYFLYNAGPYFNEAIEYMARGVYPEKFGKLEEWYGK